MCLFPPLLFFLFSFFGNTAIIFAPFTQGMSVRKPNSPCFTFSILYIFWDIFTLIQNGPVRSVQGVSKAGAFVINGLPRSKAFVIVEYEYITNHFWYRSKSETKNEVRYSAKNTTDLMKCEYIALHSTTLFQGLNFLSGIKRYALKPRLCLLTILP